MIQETQKENHAAEDREYLDQIEILKPDLDSPQWTRYTSQSKRNWDGNENNTSQQLSNQEMYHG